jgi:hypothetical protein
MRSKRCTFFSAAVICAAWVMALLMAVSAQVAARGRLIDQQNCPTCDGIGYDCSDPLNTMSVFYPSVPDNPKLRDLRAASVPSAPRTCASP